MPGSRKGPRPFPGSARFKPSQSRYRAKGWLKLAFVVFLSHSVTEEDLPYLEQLEQRCRDIGIELYLAERSPQPGSSLSGKVRSNIARADLVLALLTNHGAGSAWVNQEIGLAVSQGKRIVPVLEKGVTPPGIIAEMEYVRLDPDRPHDAFERVVTFLAKLKADKEFWGTVALVAGSAILGGLAAYFLTRRGGGNEDDTQDER